MKISILVFFSLIQFFLFGQSDPNSPLHSCFLNKEAIKSNKIVSLALVSEYFDHGPGEESMMGKMNEFEFDAEGNTIYKLSSLGNGYTPFISYGRGSILEFSEFNDEGLLVWECREDRNWLNESTFKYDENQQLIYTDVISNDDLVMKFSYKWKKGKIVDFEDLLAEEKLGEESKKFDDQGRVIEYSSGSHRYNREYNQNGDTLSITQRYYRKDTLVSVTNYTYFEKFEKPLTYFSERNYLGELTKETKVAYDEFGNIITYYSFDSSNSYWDYENDERIIPDPSVYEIENRYDNRGLLIKQFFYSNGRNSGSEMQLTRINRYFYDTDPLLFKYEKGQVRGDQLKEDEMNDDRW